MSAPVVGGYALNFEMSPKAIKYTPEKLSEDLAAGVERILSGVGAAYFMDVNPAASYILMGKSGANRSGATPGGGIRPALAITSNGIAMGYNDNSGAWHDSVAIDSGGNAIFSGTIYASGGSFTGAIAATSGSFSESITVNGVTMGTIRAGAANGATALSSLSGYATTAAIAGMLTSSASYVLGGAVSLTSNAGGFKTGTASFDSGTGLVNGGSGVVITSKGIVGVSDGQETFSINGTTGAAIFKGSITASQVVSGTFTGISVNTTGSISSSGVTASGTIGNCSIYGVVSGAGYVAVGGVSTGGTGIYGRTSAASYAGVYGESTIATGKGVWAYGTNALEVTGGMYINNSNTVPYLSASYLEGHASAYFLAASATAYDTDRVGGSMHTNIPKYAGSITAAGETHGGLTTYWATFNIGGTNYKFLIAS